MPESLTVMFTPLLPPLDPPPLEVAPLLLPPPSPPLLLAVPPPQAAAIAIPTETTKNTWALFMKATSN
jgi:hypothetical protein